MACALRSPNFAYSGAPARIRSPSSLPRTTPPSASGDSTYKSSGRLTAARISASSSRVASAGMLTVLAPRSSKILTVTGLDGDMLADTFHTIPAGSAPQPQVRDQEAADPLLGRPQDILQRVRQLAQPADLIAVGAAVGGSRVGADAVPLPGPDEQADLHARVQPGLGHVAQLAGPQQHRAAALGDPVDRDPLGLGGPQHRVEHPRTLDARDLDPERGPVREARLAIPAGDSEAVEYIPDPPHPSRSFSYYSERIMVLGSAEKYSRGPNL